MPLWLWNLPDVPIFLLCCNCWRLYLVSWTRDGKLHNVYLRRGDIRICQSFLKYNCKISLACHQWWVSSPEVGGDSFLHSIVIYLKIHFFAGLDLWVNVEANKNPNITHLPGKYRRINPQYKKGLSKSCYAYYLPYPTNLLTGQQFLVCTSRALK